MTSESDDLTTTDSQGTMAAPTDDDPFISTARIARMFDVRVPTVRDWIARGWLRATQINGRWKVRQSEVQRFARERYGLTGEPIP